MLRPPSQHPSEAKFIPHLCPGAQPCGGRGQAVGRFSAWQEAQRGPDLLGPPCGCWDWSSASGPRHSPLVRVPGGGERVLPVETVGCVSYGCWVTSHHELSYLSIPIYYLTASAESSAQGLLGLKWGISWAGVPSRGSTGKGPASRLPWLVGSIHSLVAVELVSSEPATGRSLPL